MTTVGPRALLTASLSSPEKNYNSRHRMLDDTGIDSFPIIPINPVGPVGFFCTLTTGEHLALAWKGSAGRHCFHARPFEPSIKSLFWKISSTFGDKCPQNGSKNAEMAQRTKTGYPHIGPFVVKHPALQCTGSRRAAKGWSSSGGYELDQRGTGSLARQTPDRLLSLRLTFTFKS